MDDRRKKTLFLTQFSILLAIEAIVCFTPLGSLPALGPVVMTLSHIPVVITAILLGTKAGAGMGFFFGLFSFLVWTFTPPNPAIAFVFTPFYSFGQFQGSFWSILICFAPRILIGVVTGVSYRFFSDYLSEHWAKRFLGYSISGVLGSLTNTVLVLGGIYFIFGHSYAASIDTTHKLLLGIIGTTVLFNGIPEAILGGFAAYAIGRPIKKVIFHATNGS